MRQKTALVLSAGGMFGAYQAGAYKGLAGKMEIDLVVGASAGALNGWPIAARCTPDELIEGWLDPVAGKILRLFRGAPLRTMATELHRRYTPRIPFGLMVFELAKRRTRLVQYPNISPAHLQATCSIPFVLPSVRINGRRYVDGGLFAKLPVYAAVEMGATRIIAIDVLPGIPQLIKRAPLPAGVDVTLLTPSERLGGLKDAVRWNRPNLERWVDLGRRDASELARKLECHELP